MKPTNIHPVFHQILTRADKEKFLNQRACVIWMTGLSGSGKTTIARNIELELNRRGHLTQVLDGDNIRTGINNNLGFTEEDRIENIRRIAEVSKLFVHCGIICINSFISPTREIRNMARNIIGEEDFIEVHINAPLEVCEQRDVKGLYKKAREGKIKNFTGIDAPFETPEKPAIELKTGELSIPQCVEQAMEVLGPRVSYVGDE
ncbi:MAG: adenylyl-sulfate kinase [Bacteroidales bacterium]|nr:adenylyl-sulfate kinase [Bacteroidales bacterium]MCF8351054.1 adenylyl-sulfate kinase [Bacteroidales bacterium]MCF8375880.1 adenylyl-sulfate kinase [Bacteroidales bacterium]MCF8402018.1 adenylyl-sulfate kinase [Bacteroidales bacterium]